MSNIITKTKAKPDYPYYTCLRVHKDDIQYRAKENHGITIPDKIADRIASGLASDYEPDWTLPSAIDASIEAYLDQLEEEDEGSAEREEDV